MKQGVIYVARFPNGKCYIGQTRMKFERRVYAHTFAAKGDSDLAIYRAWKKHGAPVFSILDEAPVDDLDVLEQIYIEQYGTLSPNGYNLTSGGGVGTTVAEETKAKQSASLLKPEARQANSRRMVERMQDPAFKAMVVSKLAATCATPEQNRQRMLVRMQDPAFKSKIVGNLTTYAQSDEGRKRNSENASRRMADPARRAALSEKSRQLWADPIYREKMKIAKSKGNHVNT